jgi:hypothetical protein
VLTVTIGVSVALIIGAILNFGGTWHAVNIDIQATGVILMIAGGAGLILSRSAPYHAPTRHAAPHCPGGTS